MKPPPPVIRYIFEPLVTISESDEDCMERIILYFKICGGCLWGFEKYERCRWAYLTYGYGWFERIDT